MELLKASFEKALKTKLSQKATATQGEETVLFRSFKYFDSDNDGAVSLQEWFKAIEKIGVILPSLEDLKQLFYLYDLNGNGSIDYKEFSNILYGLQEAKAPASAKASAKGPEGKDVGQDRVEELLLSLREKLAARGARGMIGLGRLFRIIDDDNSKNINQAEFNKAMKEYGLGFTEEEIKELFAGFDISKNGTIDYNEFLRIIRGKISDYRRGWIKRAYKKMDKDGNGVLELEDIKGVYNAKAHPDVKSGKKTEEEVHKEFLETFETHHNVMFAEKPDSKVTPEEFEEYYTNISASIDNDEHFALMMRNAWKLDEADTTYQKGWKGEFGAKPATGSKPGSTRTPVKRGAANVSSPENILKAPAYAKDVEKMAPPKKENAAVETLLEKSRKALASRGTKGILGIARQFKIMDDDGSKTLDIKEFTKAIRDFKIGIDEKDISTLFNFFDKDKNGTILYDEFVRSVRGEMNPFRRGLVELAFKKLDKDGSGVVDIRDLKGVFNGRNHPDVKSGKKTEDQVLGEFLETFEMHMNLGGGKNNQEITKEEFLEYYNNVSASIDDDKYFELVIVNAWKLYGEDIKKPGWAQEYSKGRPITASQSAPFGTTDEPTSYSTALRPQKKNGAKQEEDKNVLPAGYPSWPKAPVTKAKEAGAAVAGPANYGDKQLLDQFRQCLVARGCRGIMSLKRTFKIVDDDNSKELSLAEFKKVIKEYRLKFSEGDSEKLFKMFDSNHSGSINYDEFLRMVVGEMSAFRKTLVQKVFKLLDKTGDGEVSVDDLKGVYNAAKHPDVIAKKKSEEEILTEFLDTFEMHYSLLKEGERNGRVTLPEFLEYYNSISASVDDDKYFELMISNAWNLGKTSYSKGWAGQH